MTLLFGLIISFLGFGIKVAYLILGAVGIANMWFAIFAVLNAIRILVVPRD